MLSITVMALSALVSWKVRTMPACATLEADVLSMVRPSKAQCAPLPAVVGLSNPVIRLKNVVLPAPFGPISAVIRPRCTSRCCTSTAVMPPNCRTMLSTFRIGSGLPAPGLASKPAVSARRAAGSASPVSTLGSAICSDIETQLPLVAQDALWSEDHDQHQCHTDDDVGELLGLLVAHDAVRHVRRGGVLDADPACEEEHGPEHGAEDRRGTSEQQR